MIYIAGTKNGSVGIERRSEPYFPPGGRPLDGDDGGELVHGYQNSLLMIL